MDYFPIFCDLTHRAVLLVGGGEVAFRKATLLLKANAKITLVSPELHDALAQLVKEGKIEWLAKVFKPCHLDGKWFVVAATDRSDINKMVFDAANERQIFCNAVDDKDNGSCIMPAIVDRGSVVVAISSGAKAPVLSRMLREKIEVILPPHLSQQADLAGRLRERVKNQYDTMTEKRRFFERLMGNEQLGTLLQHQSNQTHSDDIYQEITRKIEALVDNLFALDEGTISGEVVLVGAGPGDPELLTIKALRQLQEADVIVYDRLVSNEVMQLARRDAEQVFVGKKAGYHCVPQEEINQTLIRLAKKGLKVVRLKGGDPFIFGRGGEEVHSLLSHKINVQVIPGITAASGCSASTGIALTHRDYAQSVSFITGHDKSGITQIDWPSSIESQQTLVFYMGLTHSKQIKNELLQRHYEMSTPVAIIENGTRPNQKVWIGALTDLDSMAKCAHSPALIIVGNVVELYKTQGFNQYQAEYFESNFAHIEKSH